MHEGIPTTHYENEAVQTDDTRVDQIADDSGSIGLDMEVERAHAVASTLDEKDTSSYLTGLGAGRFTDRESSSSRSSSRSKLEALEEVVRDPERKLRPDLLPIDKEIAELQSDIGAEIAANGDRPDIDYLQEDLNKLLQDREHMLSDENLEFLRSSIAESGSRDEELLRAAAELPEKVFDSNPELYAAMTADKFLEVVREARRLTDEIYANQGDGEYAKHLAEPLIDMVDEAIGQRKALVPFGMWEDNSYGFERNDFVDRLRIVANAAGLSKEELDGRLEEVNRDAYNTPPSEMNDRYRALLQSIVDESGRTQKEKREAATARLNELYSGTVES